MKTLATAITAVFLVLTMASAGFCLRTVELLTSQEAKLPNAKVFGMAEQRASAGPEIAVMDMEVAQGQATFAINVAFEEKDGKPVDLDTLKVQCLKSTPVDVTARVKPFAGSKGISMESVSLPPGLYRFRVAIGDVNGRMSEKDFTVKVSVVY